MSYRIRIIYLLVTIFSISFLIFYPLNSQVENQEEHTKAEVINLYCKLLSGNPDEISTQVDQIYSLARTIVVELKEIDGVGQDWAMEIRNIRQALAQTSRDELDGGRNRIETLTGEFEPSLASSVCEWFRLLKEGDSEAANRYARWEVLGNIKEAEDSVTTGFYKSILVQLTQLANTDVTGKQEEEENKEAEKEGDLPETKVCPEGCPFSSLDKAILAVKSGGIITVEPGIYDANLSIKKDLELSGVSADEVLVQGDKPGYPVLTVSGTARVKISRITLQFAKESDTEGRCVNKADGICPYGVILKGRANLDLNAVKIKGNVMGISAHDTATLNLQGCNLERNEAYAIDLSSNSTATIKDSTLSDGKAGIYLTDYAEVTISNSTLKDFGNGFFLWDGSVASVRNCNLKNLEFGAFLNDRAKITVEGNRVTKVETFIFYTPMFFSGEVIKSDNVFSEGGEEEAETVLEPKLEILGWEVSRGDGWVWVSGQARNISGYTITLAEVKGLFYDANGSLLTYMSATTIGLEDGELWDFQISAYVDPSMVDRVEVVEGESSGKLF